MALRWGIAGAGMVSEDFTKALNFLPSSSHEVAAVASRNLSSAKDFAERFSIPVAYGSYMELARDPGVDVVYVGVIPPPHLEVISLMLRSGKAVLSEKPLCVNAKETKQVIQLAREKGVFLMEGIQGRSFPVYHALRQRLQEGEIGEIRQVIVNQGWPAYHLPKISEKSQGGGITLKYGTLSVQLVSFVMNGEKPITISAAGIVNQNGVDISTGATLVYSGERMATICMSATCRLPCDALIIGTKGTIKVNSPMWAPKSMETPSGIFEVPYPDHGQPTNFNGTQGFIYEAEEVRRCLQNGLLESPNVPWQESILIAEIMEEIRMQVGVTYDQD
ncbi:trans-1,2-dihydrobenzene-1,2-diol dehydrogenase-like [Palaemon carinicauda]|uniref:trans-1,2-dihydrobenzene-1,2-diol dehydrogenase-like n=1 Tax=Palaemon carinicauda TaxID=392227 RepID=UPI0035B66FA1